MAKHDGSAPPPSPGQARTLAVLAHTAWTTTGVIARRIDKPSHNALGFLQGLYAKDLVERRRAANGYEWEWRAK